MTLSLLTGSLQLKESLLLRNWHLCSWLQLTDVAWKSSGIVGWLINAMHSFFVRFLFFDCNLTLLTSGWLGFLSLIAFNFWVCHRWVSIQDWIGSWKSWALLNKFLIVFVIEILLLIVFHKSISDWHLSLCSTVDVVNCSICHVNCWVILVRVLLPHFVDWLSGFVCSQMLIMCIFTVVSISYSFFWSNGWPLIMGSDWEL